MIAPVEPMAADGRFRARLAIHARAERPFRGGDHG